MSDNQQQPIEQATPGTTIPGEGQPEQHAPERSENETRARAMGWVDKDSFRGPSEKWVDADEFVRRGEEELPVLRERNRDLSRRFTDLETKLQKQEREFNERTQRQENLARIALAQQRANLSAQYDAAKMQAVEMGDTTRYQQLNRDQQQAIQNFDEQYHKAVEPPQPQRQNGPPPDVQAKVDAWVVENPWFATDPGMNQYAQTVHMHLQRTQPSLTVDQNFAEVSKLVRERFPEKFGRAGGGGPPAVEGGSGMPSGGGRRTRGYADLPAEAKRDVDEFVKAGAFKSRDDGAKAYWTHNA